MHEKDGDIRKESNFFHSNAFKVIMIKGIKWFLITTEEVQPSKNSSTLGDAKRDQLNKLS